jgi:DNA replication and repair protein RecF
MHLKTLSLLNFKNIRELRLEFGSGLNAFLGNNGEGKTNILDAIHYLSFCKSYFTTGDLQNISHGESYFALQGWFDSNDGELEIHCAQKKGQKKQFRKNKKEYERLSDHIGLLPLVMISPADTDLIIEGSEVRRRFVDTIISQYDKNYLDHLIDYNKVLQQRNALLKRFAETNTFSADLLDVWDFRLVELARAIHQKRREFLQEFVVLFSRYFRQISGGKEEVGLEYKSDLNEGDFFATLKNSLSRDRAIEYTQVGIHKDDLVFIMDGYPVKKFGSQGQQKSFLISLKIAQYHYIQNRKGIAPILLLDDIFDKLDDTRIARLMEMVTAPGFGQVFITDTQREKLPQMLESMQLESSIFYIREGGLE